MGGKVQVIPSHFNNLKRNCQKPLFIPFCWLHLEPWYTWIHIWIHETFEFIHEKIIWIHSLYDFILKSYMNSYMNSYIWTSEFIFTGCLLAYEFISSLYEFIYEMIVWIHIHMNWYMKWIYEFMSICIHVYYLKCIDSEFLYECISISIQIYYMKRIHVSNLNS